MGKSIRFSNRTIGSLEDLDLLVLDVAEVLRQAVEIRQHMRDGNYSLQGVTEVDESEVEVLIPFFNTALLAAQMR